MPDSLLLLAFALTLVLNAALILVAIRAMRQDPVSRPSQQKQQLQLTGSSKHGMRYPKACLRFPTPRKMEMWTPLFVSAALHQLPEAIKRSRTHCLVSLSGVCMMVGENQ